MIVLKSNSLNASKLSTQTIDFHPLHNDTETMNAPTQPAQPTYSVASFFQNKTHSEGVTTVTIEDLLSASDAVANAQEPIIESKVNTILKSIVKERQLFQRPTVGMVGDVAYNVSGRHRAEALRQLCEEYGIAANGKVTKITTENAAQLISIIPEVEVHVIFAEDLETLAHLQMTFNGSRSMTAAEKLEVHSSYRKLTPIEAIKHTLGRKFQDQLEVSFLTGLNMATAIKSKVKTLQYASDEQLQELVDIIKSWMEANPKDVPSNMALKYKNVVEPALYQMTTMQDDDGVDQSVTFVEYYSATIEKPEKATRNTKSDKAAQQIAALTAKLQELGFNPDEIG